MREKTAENVLHKVGGQMVTVDDWVYSIETTRFSSFTLKPVSDRR